MTRDRRTGLDRPDEKAVGHGPRAGDGRRPEGRRPPRHGDEPGPVGVPALPEGHAARPERPHWLGATGSCSRPGTPPITLYNQLFLGGWPRARRPPKSCGRGAQDPGHPEHRHTTGVETTTGPLARASATRRDGDGAQPRRGPARPGRRRDGESVFDHQHLRICSDGDIEEGVSAEAPSIAGHQQLGNLTVLRRQPDLDRGQHQRSPRTSASATSLRLACPDRRLDPRRHGVPCRGRPGPDAIRAAEADRPAEHDRPPHVIARPAPHAQGTGKATGPPPAEDDRDQGEILGWNGAGTSRSPTTSSRTPGRSSTAAQPQAEGRRSLPLARRRRRSRRSRPGSA